MKLAVSDLLTMSHSEREALPIRDVRDFLDDNRAPCDWGKDDDNLRFALRTWIIAELTRQKMAEVCEQTGMSNTW